MNKYFWTWLWSCILYGLGITVIVIAEGYTVLSPAYIINEMIQISALLCVFYACNLIDNIPHNLFGLKYGVLLVIFFVVYGIANTMNQTFYIAMLIFKLTLVTMAVYTVLVKWRFETRVKAASVGILGAGGIYLSLYDFLVYGSSDSRVYVCIGILLLVLQNLIMAVLYRIQTANQEKLRGDYLSIFAENSADIIFYYTINPYPRFSFVSPASQVLLGYPPQAFYTNSKLHLELAVEADREKMDEFFGGFTGDTHQCVVKAERKDGETVNLECLATKIKRGEKVVAVEGILRDITERVEAERKIKENNKNRQLMLSYISHDLKTPITYILAYAEAIQKNVIKSDAERLEAVGSIYRKASSLAKLVEDISLLSKLEASRFNYAFEEMRCRDLARHLRGLHINDFGGSDREYGVADRAYCFEVEDSITTQSVLVDVQRIEQVFENLLSNAVKVTRDGGRIHAACGMDRKKHYFSVSVSDDGWGIAETDLPHIFENFYRSPEIKKRSNGSGLGLSLSRQIILGHGGEIYAESTPGAGSRLTFLLPVFEKPKNV